MIQLTRNDVYQEKRAFRMCHEQGIQEANFPIRRSHKFDCRIFSLGNVGKIQPGISLVQSSCSRINSLRTAFIDSLHWQHVSGIIFVLDLQNNKVGINPIQSGTGQDPERNCGREVDKKKGDEEYLEETEQRNSVPGETALEHKRVQGTRRRTEEWLTGFWQWKFIGKEHSHMISRLRFNRIF